MGRSCGSFSLVVMLLTSVVFSFVHELKAQVEATPSPIEALPVPAERPPGWTPPQIEGCRSDFKTYHHIHALADLKGFFGDGLRVVDFDDVEAGGFERVEIAGNRYLTSHGVYLEAAGGLFVDDEFGWGDDYLPTSPPNMYSPGPPLPNRPSEQQTTLSWPVGDRVGCVSAIGLAFIDADHPWIASSSLSLFDVSGDLIISVSDMDGGDAGTSYVGFLLLDDEGRPVPGIARVEIRSGNVYPSSTCCEGVTLDDLAFSAVE